MKVNQRTEGSSQKTLYVGVGNVTPLIFNPTREQLDSILGIEREEEDEKKPEFEYLKEDVELTLRKKNEHGEEIEESVTTKQLRVTVWVRETKTNQIFPMNFNLYDMDDVSASGKYKFVNQHGKSVYSDSEQNLGDWFTNTPGKKKFSLSYRKAKKGEAALLEFLAKWTNISPFDVESSLFLDNEKRFWNGDMKELNNLIANFEDASTMVVFGVKTKEDEDGIKEYQSISTKGFCNSTFMKFFRSYESKQFEGLTKSSKIGDVSMYALNDFLESNFGEYGIKDYTVKAEIQVYDPNANPVNSDKSIVETDADY
jgi:hypothetical protein